MDDQKQPEEELIEVEWTSRSEYVASAYNAIASTENLDPALMSNADANRIKRIRRKSLRIIDDCINEMYSELFEDDGEE